MATFNLFDPNTWIIDQSYLERELANKALGQIGSLIGEIRELKSSLNHHFDPTTVEEYKIAQSLKRFNPEAFRIMQVHYEMPDNDEIKLLLEKIDFVLNLWKSVPDRHNNWRSTIVFLQDIVPYLKNNQHYKLAEFKKITVIVHGNEAWKAYCSAVKSYNNYYASVRANSFELERMNDE